jgi:hypothetical protein
VARLSNASALIIRESLFGGIAAFPPKRAEPFGSGRMLQGTGQGSLEVVN